MFSARSPSLWRVEHQIAIASAVSAVSFWLQWQAHQGEQQQRHQQGQQGQRNSIHLWNHGVKNDMNLANITFCEADGSGSSVSSINHTNPNNNSSTAFTSSPNTSESVVTPVVTDEDNTTMFHGQCLSRQLRRPKLPYPAWDYNWDHRETEATSKEALSGQAQFAKSKSIGQTRHILLIRHGQYDERFKDDRRRRLTPLGRHQAELTGQRLALLARGGLQGGSQLIPGNAITTTSVAGHKPKPDQSHTVTTGGSTSTGSTTGGNHPGAPLYFKAIHSSDMERAKETARIIHSHLPHVKLNPPDPILNEALPAP